MEVEIGIVEELVDLVNARVRIPNVHGDKGGSDSIPTIHLPTAMPSVPSVGYDNDEQKARIKIGDKLYLLQVSDDLYLYIGKEYKKSDNDGTSYEMYVKDDVTGTGEDRKYKTVTTEFGGFNINAKGNKLEIISAKKSGSVLSDYCGIEMNSETGNLMLISKKGNKKVILELSADVGTAELRVVSGGTIISTVNLGNFLNLKTAGRIVFMGNDIDEIITNSLGSDSTEWGGKIV